jgi:acyl carrier protein
MPEPEKLDDLDARIHAAVLKVARQRGATLTSVESHHRWTVDLGLKSLDLAQIVALLERQTGVDPFAELVPITSIRTVGDLAAAYRRCLSGEAPPETGDDLAAGRERAERRLAARSRRDTGSGDQEDGPADE